MESRSKDEKRQDVIQELDFMLTHYSNLSVFIERSTAKDILELLKEQTGHWNGPECSACHAILEKKVYSFEYCPYCGAHMIESEN